jgi:peptidoglycan/xylan/chitin deacetylase (PgdA/CDA1 family)
MPATGDERLVYLTYDDGPNPDATPALLDELQAQDATATFFIIDSHVTPDTAWILRRTVDEGHALAVHSSERWLLLQTPEAIAARIGTAAAHIGEAAGRPPCPAFRPHAGWRSSAMLLAVERLDYALVGWGWNRWDWNWFRRRDPERVARRLARDISPGTILVLHDGHHRDPRPERRYTVETTRHLVPHLRAQGFGFGRICEPGAP